MSEWISVDDGLPKPFSNVIWFNPTVHPDRLVYCGSMVTVNIQGATHWMPLPEPPTK